MAKSGNEFRVELDVTAGKEPVIARPLPDTPFRIALFGNFGGSTRRPSPAAAVIDRDNVDEVIGRFAPALDLTLEDGSQVPLRFAALEDFHPDRLYERLGLFASLRELRKRLADPGTFAETARQLRGEPAPRQESRAGSAGLLDQILTANDTAAEKFEAAGGDLHAFIQRILAPHLVAHTDPRQAPMVAEVDAAISGTMRTILHHADFQALESAWRAAVMMAMRLDTSSTLEITVIDMPRTALSAAAVTEAARASADDDHPWSLLVGLYTFGADAGDLTLLGALAQAAAHAGAPWLSGAHPRLAGSEAIGADPSSWAPEPVAEWSALRRGPHARVVGLVLPRFLLRLPYGKQTDECERFAFEEMPAAPVHDDYLWGNGAIAPALLAGQAFADVGWRFQPGRNLDLPDLPLHLFKRDGVTVTQPCAETLLAERAVLRILDAGLMPLASFKDQDQARLVRLQSIADPPAPLAGRWG